MAVCTICEKRASTGNRVSHSQIHTKRKFKPNLQKVNGLILCTRCLKTIKMIQKEDAIEESKNKQEQTRMDNEQHEPQTVN